MTVFQRKKNPMEVLIPKYVIKGQWPPKKRLSGKSVEKNADLEAGGWLLILNSKHTHKPSLSVLPPPSKAERRHHSNRWEEKSAPLLETSVFLGDDIIYPEETLFWEPQQWQPEASGLEHLEDGGRLFLISSPLTPPAPHHIFTVMLCFCFCLLFYIFCCILMILL